MVFDLSRYRFAAAGKSSVGVEASVRDQWMGGAVPVLLHAMPPGKQGRKREEPSPVAADEDEDEDKGGDHVMP